MSAIATKAHLEGNRRYLETLDELKVRMPKGKKSLIKSHAESRGESLNGFINRAIDETMERDSSGRDK